METLKHLAWPASLITLLVLLIVYARRKEVRAKKFRAESNVDFEDLKHKYSKWEHRMALVLLFFCLLIAFTLTGVFAALMFYLHSRKAHYQYLVLPSLAAWVPHGLAMSWMISLFPTILLCKRWLGPVQYSEFELYGILKEGPDTKKLLLFLALMVVAVECVMLPLSFDWYVRITNDQIMVSRFWDLGETAYSFQDVAEVRLVKSQKTRLGEITRRTYHEIAFSDGYTLSFDKSWHNLNRKEEFEVVDFIARRSNKQVKLEDPYPKGKR
jgi:hypothetical protein